MARATTRVFVSDALIIKACNTPGGSGGVYRDVKNVAYRTAQRARTQSPVNNALNARSFGHSAPGEYRRSFRVDGKGSNGHIVKRTIKNISDHAYWVEHGRKSTRFGERVMNYEYWTGHKDRKTGHWIWHMGPGYEFSFALRGLGKWEKFSWAKSNRPGVPMWNPGSAGYAGKHILERAFHHSTRKYNVSFMKGWMRPVV